MNPKITTERTDIVRLEEALETIKNAEGRLWLQALIAVAWMYGKRISENLALRRQDVEYDKEYLTIRFKVLKKKKKQDGEEERDSSGIPLRYRKQVTIHHKGAIYVLKYLQATVGMKGDELLFQRRGRPVTRHDSRYYLRKANPNVWWHLFRHSKATIMAEKGNTVPVLMTWFDWSQPETAIEYVSRAGATILTEPVREATDW